MTVLGLPLLDAALGATAALAVAAVFLAALLRPDLWVADIIYFPLETELLRQARRIGCRTLSGAGMAVYQAVRAFEHFTGIAPDIDRMKAAFEAFDGTPGISGAMPAR